MIKFSTEKINQDGIEEEKKEERERRGQFCSKANGSTT